METVAEDTLVALREYIDELREARIVAAEYTHEVALAQEKLEQTQEWQALQRDRATLADAKARVAEVEDCVRRLTCDAYEATGEKKPVEGVGIRVRKVLDYRREQAAEWIKGNMPALLAPNWKQFEKVAKAGIDGAPVTIRDEVTATIAKEL